MNISLNRRSLLAIVGTVVVVTLLAFLLPKAFVHGDVPPTKVTGLEARYSYPDLSIGWGEPMTPGDGTLHYNVDVVGQRTAPYSTETGTPGGVVVEDLASDVYTVTVTAENEFGISDPISVEVNINAVPPVPTGFNYSVAEASNNIISVSWAVPGTAVLQYIVAVSDANRNTTEYIVDGALYEWTSEALPDGGYSVTISAKDSDTAISAASDPLSMTLGGGGGDITPVAPQNLAYDSGQALLNNLYLSWDEDVTGDISDYRIQVIQGKTTLVDETILASAKTYSTPLDPGTYTVNVSALYPGDLHATSTLDPVVIGPDESVQITAITATLSDDPTIVRINWTTDVPADSLVTYGPGKVFDDNQVASATLETDHQIVLSDLFLCTVYNYKVTSSDGEISGESTVKYFITNGCAKGLEVSDYIVNEILSSKIGDISLTDDAEVRKALLSIPLGLVGDVASVIFELKQLAVTVASEFETATRKLSSGEVFDIKAFSDAETKVEEFEEPVQVTLNFIPSDLTEGTDIDTLAIWHSDDEGVTWTKLTNCSLSYDLEEDTGHVVCDTYGFSLFAIFSDESDDEGTPVAQSSGGSSTKRVATNDLVPVSSPEAATFSFTYDLYFGLHGPEVKKLQQTLNSLGFFVAKYGAGSVGNETSYYGPRTRAAVMRFQEAHTSETLTPYGFTKGTGRLGPYTRVVLNAMLAR